MSLIIERGILKKYKGSDAHVRVPDGVSGIGGKAFFACKQLVSVELPEGLTGIGAFAFKGCENLTSVTFPESLLRVDGDAFRGCKRLLRADLPRGVKHLGFDVFRECRSLVGVTLPEGLQEIASGLFRDCESLREIALPEGLLRIGDSAFEGCQGLQSVTLPRSLVKIGTQAFFDCTSLLEVDIPDGVTVIEYRAFGFCKSLARLRLPPRLMRIEQDAFYLARLRRIVLPPTVEYVGHGAFGMCDDAEEFSLVNADAAIEQYAMPIAAIFSRAVFAPMCEDRERLAYLIGQMGERCLLHPLLVGGLQASPTAMEMLSRMLEDLLADENSRYSVLYHLIRKKCAAHVGGVLARAGNMTADEIDRYIVDARDCPEIRMMLMRYRSETYGADGMFAL